MNSFLDDQPTFLRDFDEMIAAAPDEGTPVSPDKIIPISAGDRGQQRVNARDLHEFLEVGKDFSTWIKDRISKYEFVEGQDYLKSEDLSSPESGSAKARPQVVVEYSLTMSMAKELSMVERSDRGKLARQYFIECERRLLQRDPIEILSDPAAMRGLLLDYCEKVLALQEEVKTLAPKAAGLDLIAGTEGSMCISDAAKTLGQRPRAFFAMLSNARWIFRRGNEWIPFQDKQDKGWMEAKVTLIPRDDLDKVTTQARITPAGLAQLAKMIGRATA